MNPTLAPILDLLDDGLRLYRRRFSTFAALAAIGSAPSMLFSLGSIAASFWISPALGALLNLLSLVVGVPCLIYAVAAISRATLAQSAGQPIGLGQALRFAPQRLLGIGCYGTLMLVGMNIAATVLSLICICPAYLLLFGAFGAGFAVLGDGGTAGMAGAGLLAIGAILVFVLIYLVALAIGGAAYCSTIFSLQPLVHEKGGFGAAVQHSFDLLGYRFGHNLLIFLAASLVFGAISVAALLAVGALLPLPLLIAFGAESPVAQATAGIAWLIGVVLAAPAMPIWMALLYERRIAARGGADLRDRIAALTPAGQQ